MGSEMCIRDSFGLPGYLVLGQVDFVGNFVFTHGSVLLFFVAAGQKKTPLSLALTAGTEAIQTLLRCHP